MLRKVGLDVFSQCVARKAGCRAFECRFTVMGNWSGSAYRQMWDNIPCNMSSGSSQPAMCPVRGLSQTHLSLWYTLISVMICTKTTPNIGGWLMESEVIKTWLLTFESTVGGRGGVMVMLWDVSYVCVCGQIV